MKQLLIILYIFLSLSSSDLYAQELRLGYEEQFERLSIESRKSLNLSGSISEDSIIQLCKPLIDSARQRKDYSKLFLIEQIAVNSHCMNGDIAIAVNIAQQMYDESRKIQDDICVALSIQALGNTLLHSHQYEKAYETYNEAVAKMPKSADSTVLVRLLIQKLNVCSYMNDTREMYENILRAESVIDMYDLVSELDYVFYVKCYRVLYYIMKEDMVSAQAMLKEFEKLNYHPLIVARWRNYLLQRYYIQLKEYDKALSFTDTALLQIKDKKGVEYLQMLIYKADILEKMELFDEACAVHEQLISISALIDSQRYLRQIESLHSTYWVDQIKLENAAAQNKLLVQIVVSIFIVILMAGLLLAINRRKNRRLIKSRENLSKLKDVAYNSIQHKSMFLSNMSHDLRTPLNALVGFSEILTMGGDDVDEETKVMCGEHIKQNSELLTKLFSDIIDLASLSENSIRFTFNECDVLTLCGNVIDTVKNVNRGTSTLHFSTTLTELKFITDHVRLQQVLINLLVNATKFTDKGTITLKLEKDLVNNEVVFIVEDTGCGIPLDRQPYIFERFEKLHENKSGVGLGLSICNLIITRFGGKIWIDSHYTEGARFVFTHPLEVDVR